MKSPNLSELAILHKPLTIYFMLLIVLVGGAAYFNLGRNEDPEFTIKTMVVQTVWPGATQNEMMQQVTDRIEKKLQETPYLDYLKSYTTAGQSTVFVTLQDTISKQEVSNVWYQVRKKIGDIKQTLPQEILGPFFNDEFDDTYGIIYAFTADGFTHRELRDYVEKSRSRILQIPDIAKVEILGAQDERIYVEFSTHRLSQLGLDRLALLKALEKQNAVVPSGVIETNNEKVLVEVSGRFLSDTDLRQINFSVGSHMVRLSDIATVKRGNADPPQPMFRVNGKDAIGLACSMRHRGDILALEQNVDSAIAQIKADLPVGIETYLVANQPQVVHHAVNEFMEALWEAIAIVLGISFLSLGLRAGMIVACSIPLVLAAVFIAMQLFGIDLQRISLGALIIALGLLVDDAMITVESMVTKLEQGWNTIRAATFAYTSTAFPMLTGTLVTMFGFVPVGFAKSAAGEYTFSLFAVVSIALLASWVVAVIFAPVIGTMFFSSSKKLKKEKEARIIRGFNKLLLFSMRHAKLTMAATFTLFALSLLLIPLVPSQFFPSSDRPELIIDMNLPHGASIYATDRASQKLDAILKEDPDIDHWSSYIGRGAVRFYLPLDVQLQNDFFAETVVVAKSPEARDRVQKRLEMAMQEKIPEVVNRIFPLELGPPVGWPVQYRVSGEDPLIVRDYAYKVAQTMGSSPELRKINYNWMEPIRTLRIDVNQDHARILGLSSTAIAKSIYTVVSGVTTTHVRDNIYLIDVVVRAQAAERMSIDAIRGLMIPLPSGKTVPITELATIDYEEGLPLVWRRNRLPTLTVQADVAKDVLPATAVIHLKAKIEKIREQLPPGYYIVDGGTVEESTKSEASVGAVFPLMLILMLTVLMIQLQNFSHLFLVLSVAPLGIIGVVLALLLMHQPLGFVALLGIVALAGMIIRNSVILVHQIGVEEKAGRSRWDAVVEATMLRFRPIMLTAAAAILGMIPIAPTVFWGPMANAIMGGLAVATLLTLIFLPSLYITWFKIKEEHAREIKEAHS